MVCIRKSYGFVVLLLALGFTAHAFGQETPQLEEIVVTANRSEAALNEIGSSISVISREEIDRKHATLVLDFLRTVPALNVVRSIGIALRLGSRTTNTPAVPPARTYEPLAMDRPAFALTACA